MKQKTLITFSNQDISDRNTYLREISCTIDVIEHLINQPDIDKFKVKSKINYMHGLILKICDQKYIVSHIQTEEDHDKRRSE